MLRTLLLLCLSIGAFGRHYNRHTREVKSEADVAKELKDNLFNKLPHCQEALGDDFALSGCPDEVKQCMKQTRNKGMMCIVKEIGEWKKQPKIDECHKKHAADGQKWIQHMCHTKMDIKRCMDNEEPPTVPSEYNEEHHVGVKDFMKHSVKHHLNQDCWKDMHKSYKECKDMAMEKCNDRFKACSGREKPEDDEKLLKWYKIARHNKHEVVHKLKDTFHAYSKCVGLEHKEHDTSSESSSHSHSGHHDSSSHSHSHGW